MRSFYNICKQDFINLVMNPMWIFYSTAFPILMIAIMGFLTEGSYGDVVTSYDYYGISLMIYTALSAATIAANSFMEEKIKAGNMRIIFAPVSESYLYLSKIVATFLFTTIFYLIDMLFVNLLFGVNYGGDNIGYVILIFLFAQFFASTLGVMFCCLLKSESTANQILSLVITIFSILGGTFFSLDGFGETVRKISLLSPVKWMMDAMFGIIYDNRMSGVLPTIGVLLGGTIILLILCKLTFSKEDYV